MMRTKKAVSVAKNEVKKFFMLPKLGTPSPPASEKRPADGHRDRRNLCAMNGLLHPGC